MSVNTIIFIWWFLLMIVPWFFATTSAGGLKNWRFNATEGDGIFWDRTDSTFSNFMNDITGIKSTGILYDSWFFYSGYPGSYTIGTSSFANISGGVNGTGDYPYMTKEDWASGMNPILTKYYMDAAYVTCCFATVLTFGLSVFFKINDNFSERKIDPVVERDFAYQQRRKYKGPPVEPDKPFSSVVLGFYDHAIRGRDKVSQMNRALKVKLKTAITSKMPSMAFLIKYGMVMQYWAEMNAPPKRGEKGYGKVFQAIVTFDALDSIELYPKTKSHELLVDHRFYTDYFKGQAASDAELNDTFGTTDYKEIAKHFFMKNADGSAFQRSCLHDDFRKFYSGHGGLDDETNQETTKQVNDSFSILTPIDTRDDGVFLHRHRRWRSSTEDDGQQRDECCVCSCYAAKKHAERDQQVVDMELDALGDPSESEGDSKVIEVKKQGPQEPTTSSKSFPSGSGSGSDQVAAQEETTKSDEHYDDHGTKGLFKDWQRAFREDPEHPLDSKCFVAGDSVQIYKSYSAYKKDTADKDELIDVFGTADPVQCALAILKVGCHDIMPHRAAQLEDVKAGNNKSVYEHSRINSEYKDFVQHAKDQKTFKYIYIPDSDTTETHSKMAQKLVGLFLTFVLLGITCAGVVLVTTYNEWITNKFSYGPQLILTSIKSVIPALVKICIKFENWENPETIMRMTLVRVYVLKMATLFVLIYNLYTVANEENECIEAVAALQFYKLIIINSLTVCATNLASFGGLYYWYRKEKGEKAKTQYDHEYVSQAYIDLNYNQGLFLIGVLYAPMLPILWVIMNALEFVVLVMCLRWFCRLAEKPYESKDANYTLWYLSTTWIICAFPTANFLASSASQNCRLRPLSLCVCGPFQADIEMKYYALANFMADEMDWLTHLYGYLLNPMIVYGIIIVLAIVILWLTTQLRQVRNQCVDTYLMNFYLIRDKHRINKETEEELEAKQSTIEELEETDLKNRSRIDPEKTGVGSGSGSLMHASFTRRRYKSGRPI